MDLTAMDLTLPIGLCLFAYAALAFWGLVGAWASRQRPARARAALVLDVATGLVGGALMYAIGYKLARDRAGQTDAGRILSSPSPASLAGRFRSMAKGLAICAPVLVVAASLVYSTTLAREPYPDFKYGLLESALVLWALTAAAALTPLLVTVSVLGRSARRHTRGALYRIVVIALVAPAIWASITLASTSGYRDQVRTLASHFAPACAHSTPVTDAAAYTGGKAIIIVLDGNGDPGKWTGEALRRGRSSLDVPQIELVVCLGEEQETTHTCHYTQGGTWDLDEYWREVRIVEARSGATMATQTFNGGGYCPSEKPTGSWGVNQGSSVAWNDVKIWNYILQPAAN